MCPGEGIKKNLPIKAFFFNLLSFASVSKIWEWWSISILSKSNKKMEWDVKTFFFPHWKFGKQSCLVWLTILLFLSGEFCANLHSEIKKKHTRIFHWFDIVVNNYSMPSKLYFHLFSLCQFDLPWLCDLRFNFKNCFMNGNDYISYVLWLFF